MLPDIITLRTKEAAGQIVPGSLTYKISEVTNTKLGHLITGERAGLVPSRQIKSGSDVTVFDSDEAVSGGIIGDGSSTAIVDKGAESGVAVGIGVSNANGMVKPLARKTATTSTLIRRSW